MTVDQFLTVSTFWIGLFAILFLIGILITGLLVFNKILRQASLGKSKGSGAGDEPDPGEDPEGFGDTVKKVNENDAKIANANIRITNLNDKTNSLIGILENMTNSPFTPDELSQLTNLKNSEIEPPENAN